MVLFSVYSLDKIFMDFAAALDIILSWKSWGSMQCSQIFRYLLKFAVATAWIIILPLSYSSSAQNPTGLTKFFSNWAGDWRSQYLYSYAIVIYMLPNILAAMLFMLPPLRRAIERSNRVVIIFLIWWAQASVYCIQNLKDMLLVLELDKFLWDLFFIISATVICRKGHAWRHVLASQVRYLHLGFSISIGFLLHIM